MENALRTKIIDQATDSIAHVQEAARVKDAISDKPVPVPLPLPLPLSKSTLWQLQRKFFQQRGVEAWQQNIVPSYVTTNSFIAHAYAQLVNAYLLGCYSEQRTQTKEIIYIFELGAGSGRFCYHFLNHFLTEYKNSPLARQKFCYVMTDISESNIYNWLTHEKFKPYIAQGILDFAIFNASQDDSLKLLVSERTLSPAKQSNPMVVVANYLFDTIEQDLFDVKGGELREYLTSISHSIQTEKKFDLNSIEVSYQPQICSTEYYEDSNWNKILEYYQQNLVDSAFLFPVGSLNCIKNLVDLSGNQLLILSGDKGQTQLTSLQGNQPPDPVRHGSFSLSVNYNALIEYTKLIGGQALHTLHPAASINVVAFLFGHQDFTQINRAYQREIIEFGPDDFFMIKKTTEGIFDSLLLPQITALLRMSYWDAALLPLAYDRLTYLLPQASPQQQQSFKDNLLIMWERYFPIGEEVDLAFFLGNLMAAMCFYREALNFFEISARSYGENEAVNINIELCRQRISEEKIK